MADLEAPQLVIDDYEALIIDALVHTNVISNGVFTDLDPSGFMRPFVGTMAYAGSELLYTANQSAIAAAKSFLINVLGVPEDAGTKAVITLQFGLTTALATDFIVPKDFQVSDSSGKLRYYTQNNLVIPAGALFGTTTAIAEEPKEIYNVSVGFINTLSQPLTYLSYVTNLDRIIEGKEARPIEDLIERAAQIIRIRNPVSALDFEQLAESIMGDGSRAKAIGLLGLSLIPDIPQLGVVHLFLLDSGGKPANPSLISLVGNTISPRIMLGTKLLISPLQQLDVVIDMIANSTGSFSMQELSDRCWEALQIYLSHKTFPIGNIGEVLLEEIKYVLRSVTGLVLSYVTINDDPLNVPMPNDWTQARLTGLNVELVDDQGVVFRDNHFIIAPNE